jgi:hypothetical protein
VARVIISRAEYEAECILLDKEAALGLITSAEAEAGKKELRNNVVGGTW